MATRGSAAVLEKRRATVLFALLTTADTVAERLVKARVAETLLASRKLRQEGLDRNALLLLVEDDAGLLPRNRIWDIVRSMPILEPHDGLYRLKAQVRLTDFQRDGERPLPRALQTTSWSLDEVTTVFFPVEENPWTVRDVRTAIQRGYKWFLWTLTEGMSGYDLEFLPAFWECGQGRDTPIGELRAETSVGDTLASLADSHLFACSVGTVPGDQRAAFAQGLRQLLRYPIERDTPPDWDEYTRVWNRGGFLPYDDQPEAAYPTVDATWDAVLALSSMYDQFDRLTEAYGSLEMDKRVVGAALLDGAEFLLRMQLPEGGWGIYQYRNDEPRVPPSEFTTGQTVLALSLLLGSTAFEDLGRASLRPETDNALRKAWRFLHDRAVDFDGPRAWVPFFGASPDDAPAQDILRATIWTGTGLLALYRACPDLCQQIGALLRDVVALTERHWRPDHKRSADFDFRVPLTGRLHDVFGKWSNRYDVTVVILLLDLFNQSSADDGLAINFSADLWTRIERALGQILKEQHAEHGHWHEPLEGLPLAAATAMATQALQYYLIAVGHLAGRSDVPQA